MYHLEEKLQSETLSRVQRERDADEHKDLWNSEVKSRSKLGLKVSLNYFLSKSSYWGTVILVYIKELYVMCRDAFVS